MLAIIHCFEKWDAELWNVKLEIRIDHKNLEYFMTVKKMTEKQIKWGLIFSKYDFVYHVRKQRTNWYVFQAKTKRF